MSALPPGPRLPAAAQTVVWVRRAQWMLDQCSRRFGDTFLLRILNQGTWVVISNPADVETIFKAGPSEAFAGEGNAIMEPVLGDRSLLLLDGREHLAQRRLMLPAFHGARMASYTGLISEIAAAEIDRWPRGEPQRLRPRMQALTLEVILRAVLGVTDPVRRDELRVALRRMLTTLTDPRWATLILLLGPRRLPHFAPFRRLMEAVDRPLLAEIAERRAAEAAGGGVDGREDILSLFVAARYEDGAPMEDRELRDELITLLIAGHETTANALAWAVERLVRHPDKLARLTEEAAGDGDAYATAVVQETLRLRPVISIVQRVLKVPMAVAGYDLPAGTIVVPSLYLVNRRPEVYERPESFEPERFLARPPGTYTWIPFGGGTRRCLGAAFAQHEMKTVLRELVGRAALAPLRPEPEPNLRRAIVETPRHDAEVLVGSMPIREVTG